MPLHLLNCLGLEGMVQLQGYAFTYNYYCKLYTIINM